MQILTAAGAGFVAGLVLAVGHYAIHRIRRGRPAHPIANYVYGTLTLFGAFSGWAALVRPTWPLAIAGYAAIMCVAGAFDAGCYVLDALADRKPEQMEKADQAELEVRRQRA